jgi:signal transduction histidine kinase
MLILDDPGAWSSSREDAGDWHPTHARWMRSRALGAPSRGADAAGALGKSALAARRERFSPVLTRANDVLGDAIVELNRRGFAVAFADQDGFILRSWGAQSFEERGLRAGFSEGSCWSEAARGTNAIGTALAERTSVAVLGRAHYASDAQELVCYAALIRNPISSSVGVLDVTGPYAAADPLLGVLVESLATSLESSLSAEGLRHNLSLRDEVLAMVAHDLRSPISTISMSANSLEQRLAARAQDRGADSRSVQAIARSTERMSRMVDDLLEVARAEAGRLAVTLRPLSVASIMNTASELARATAPGLQRTIEYAPGAGDVLADRDRTLQVFANLIGNAAKFTPEGGRLTLGCARGADDVCFYVRDSGAGIRYEHLPKVFDRGFQAQSNDRRGAGLGLYICKALVEAQGGAIWVESEPGQGATFYFSLPAA